MFTRNTVTVHHVKISHCHLKFKKKHVISGFLHVKPRPRKAFIKIQNTGAMKLYDFE